ncbi:MAG: flagellar basal body-associated FliL family protein, partial [Paracoccaceae bacterium]
ANEKPAAEPDLSSLEYVKLNNQFIIPVVNDGQVVSLVVMSLNLEVAAGGRELVYQREPKLRDVFLQVLFDHANAGGFDGAFTSGSNMTQLRDALRESAKKTLGETLTDVLIVDVVRQDV